MKFYSVSAGKLKEVEIDLDVANRVIKPECVFAADIIEDEGGYKWQTLETVFIVAENVVEAGKVAALRRDWWVDATQYNDSQFKVELYDGYELPAQVK